jgi:hypothetical protein
MEYNSYDELVQRVRVFRLEHADLPPDELAKLILRTFKIDRSVLREIDGIHLYQIKVDPMIKTVFH